MNSQSLAAEQRTPLVRRPNLHVRPTAASLVLFVGLLAGGLLFIAWNLAADMEASGGMPATTWVPYVLLGVALFIALGFEFVNGFHDTANAVATVIYTHSLPPNFAVLWSGLFNFLGVLVSSGAVAFSVLALLPVELILKVGSSAGFAMVFALLLAAIIWNLGTWWLGLPASSSHTLIGSIIGVGVANALMHGRDGTAGVDWAQATKVGYALLFSPIIGFVCAALLLLALRLFVKNRELYESPKDGLPPPWWIRGLLVVTCTGVSFAHGSNDGQKGMGLIMLILVGIVPTAYALNRAMPERDTESFIAAAETTWEQLHLSAPRAAAVPAEQARQVLADYVRTKKLNGQVLPALEATTESIAQQVRQHGSFTRIPAAAVRNVRNDMYLSSEALSVLEKSPPENLSSEARQTLAGFHKQLERATRFIPWWVKVAVAIALGLGTMVGWRRIVVTVGEKIGKTHLSYGQGASAELVAMATIGAADAFGLPVSTTHVLSSGVAGSMAANGSGLQWRTVRNLALAWVLTLPAAMLLAGCLYWLLTQVMA